MVLEQRVETTSKTGALGEGGGRINNRGLGPVSAKDTAWD